MGTASTMTAIAEALGMALPGSTSIPAMDAAHPRMAADCGERIVAMIDRYEAAAASSTSDGTSRQYADEKLLISKFIFSKL
jgi:dihydroxyacid dehydratase/phosphogluconate dehydratase